MAYRQELHKRAKELYVLEGKKVTQISEIMCIAVDTLNKWKAKDEWDKSIKSGGTVNTFMEFWQKFNEQLQQAIAENKLNDSKTADGLLKSMKLLKSLMPDQLLLSNMFQFLQDVTIYASEKIRDKYFLELWQDHIERLGDYLRLKYAGKVK